MFKKRLKYNIGDYVSYTVMDYLGRWYIYYGTITATRVTTTSEEERKDYLVNRDWVPEKNIEKIFGQ